MATVTSAQDFRAYVQPESGSSDDSFTLTVVVEANDISQLGSLAFDESSDFSLSSTSEGSRIQIINGVQTNEKYLNYTFRPKRNLEPGKYSLPKGKFSKANNLEIANKIVEITKASSAPVDLIQTVSKQNPYVGEQITYKVDIAAGTKIVDANIDEIDFQDFWKESYGNEAQTQRKVKNVNIFTIKEALFPLRTGKIQIPSRTLSTGIYEIDANRRNRSWTIFDELMPELSMRNDFRRKNIKRTAKGIELNVRELPKLDFPYSSYIPVGTVSINSNIDKTSLELGDSINLSITLEGDANLRSFTLPKIKGIDAEKFTIYEDKTELQSNIKNEKINFVRKFSIALVPKEHGELDLPYYEIVVFNPQREEYIRYQSKRQRLKIRKSDKQNSLIISNGQKSGLSNTNLEPEKQEINLLAEDILPLHKTKESLSTKNQLPKNTLLVVFIFGVLIVIANKLLIAGKNRDQRYLMFRNSLKEAEEALAKASSYTEINDCYRTYLSNRIHDRISGLTAKEVLSALEKATNNQKIAKDSANLLSEIDKKQFSANKENNNSQLEVFKEDVMNNMKAVNASTKSYHRIKTLFCLALLFSNFLYADNLNAQNHLDIASSLDAANKAYETLDYDLAIKNYKLAIEKGASNASVYYNLANSHLKKKEYGKAIYNYRKALLEKPRDPDIKANLGFARQKTKDKIESSSANFGSILNQALLFRKSMSESESEIAWIIIYLITCCLVIANSRFKNDLIKNAMLSFIFLSTYFSICTFFVSHNSRGEIVLSLKKLRSAVILDETADVYSGDSENYQVVFILNQGAEVEVSDERNNWLEIMLPGGTKGWVKSDSVGVL